MLFDFDTNPGPTNNESSSVDNRKKRCTKNMELPLFSYESISVATGQFSDKLGEGGFGPVYKVSCVQMRDADCTNIFRKTLK